jgi:hypothetical protein
MTSRHLLKRLYSLTETHNARQNTRKNTAKVVLGLTVVFLFSYLPFRIFKMYLILSINFEKSNIEFVKELTGVESLVNIMSILDVLLSMNSCLNPVALFITSLAFRTHLKRYLT